MSDVTEAVKRAAYAIGDQTNTGGHIWLNEAQVALAAALDVEEMARAMHGYAESERVKDPDALGHRPRRTWEETSEMNRQVFRKRARHLRAALLGES